MRAKWLTEGVFLGVKILNFIIHAYSFSFTFVRQLLAAARSRSGENNTQLFSKTLAPLRYLAEKAYQNTRHKAQTNARKLEIYLPSLVREGG